MIGMLCTSNALAMSYSIQKDYGSMCASVRKAFAEGMVLDATRPLCERRFELSPQAKRLGLSNVDKNLLPRSAYPNLLRKIITVTGGKKWPQSEAFRQDAAAADRLMKLNIKIYSSHFDSDNSGVIRKVYIEDLTYCADRDSYPYGSVTTYIQKSDGSLDPSWGVRNATAGVPFIYEDHTYYMTWRSWKGGVDKNRLAEIDISDASPYEGVFRKISSYNAFPPPYCIIYQTKKRIRP